MKRGSIFIVATTCLSLLLAIGIGIGVWSWGFGSALDAAALRGKANLSLASDRVSGQLQRYRELAVLLADHPILRERLLYAQDSGPGLSSGADALLRSVADKTGALNIVLLDDSGEISASADPFAAAQSNFATSSLFARAMHGALGTAQGLQPQADTRSFSFAAPIYQQGASPLGVVLVISTVEGIESDWRADPNTLIYSDQRGVVFLSSRSELVLDVLPFATEDRLTTIESYPENMLSPFPEVQVRNHGTHEIWDVQGGPYVPETALHLSQELPIFGLTGHILIDARPLRRLATLEAALATGFVLALLAFLALVAARRHRLTTRLAHEAAANEVLEAKVAERTHALSRSNAALRREVQEREDAEAALKTAQANLVQAAKLSALGQMSAGLSHELNQPLMAIQAYADNTEILIDKGRYDVAERNVSQISEMARRMGRIIKNLRAFARQEDAPLSDVDVVAVIEAVLEISARRRKELGVDLDWVKPLQQPVRVRAGEVRLQQVLLNLCTNAIEAMQGAPNKCLILRVVQDVPGRVMVVVRDTGPGIEQPERIFDPFYSTKEIGDSDGMGLGLSISYGLVQSFGGDITGSNAAQGGAQFVVSLARAGVAVAA